MALSYGNFMHLWTQPFFTEQWTMLPIRSTETEKGANM